MLAGKVEAKGCAIIPSSAQDQTVSVDADGCIEKIGTGRKEDHSGHTIKRIDSFIERAVAGIGAGVVSTVIHYIDGFSKDWLVSLAAGVLPCSLSGGIGLCGGIKAGYA